MTDRVGAWTFGVGLAVFAGWKLFGLPDEWELGFLLVAALVAGTGLMLTAYGLAGRLGVAGLGAGLCGLGLAVGLVNALLNLDELLVITMLTLLAVGVPVLVRVIVDRTGFLGVSALIGSVGLAGVGTAATAMASLRMVSMPEGLSNLIELAVVLGVLAGAVASGMVIATPHAGPARLPRVAIDRTSNPREEAPEGTPEEPDETAEETPEERSTTANLTTYQRLTLVVAAVSTVVSAVIGVAGSVIAAMISR